MAHIREFRRRAYFQALATSPDGEDLTSIRSDDDLDEVLYHPRRLVCSAPPEDPTRDLGPLKDAVRQRLSDADKRLIEDTVLPGFEVPPNLWIFQWSDPEAALAPAGAGIDVPDEEPRNDSFRFAVELDDTEEFKGMVSPMYYTVTQQGVQPGEDPEPSGPVLGIRPPAAAIGPDIGGLGEGVHIAVIDTGIDPDAVAAGPLPNQHFDNPGDLDLLHSRTAAGPPSALLGPAAGHGTFIASLIHCVAPGAEVHSIRVASPMGTADEATIAEGIRHAWQDLGANLINLSLGGYPFVRNSMWPTLPAFKVLEAAIDAVPKGIAIVAAAGNCGSNAEFFPAAFPRVIGVAALDVCGDRLWCHSNYGAWVKACTRGVNLRGLFVRGDEDPDYDPDGMAEHWLEEGANWATWSGTSFAAPLVAAQIAIVAAEMGWVGDTTRAADALLSMSKRHIGQKRGGKRILVDLPGQM